MDLILDYLFNNPNIPKTQKPPTPNLNVGMMVKHDRFKIGRVVSIDGDKCIIEFDCGQKKLITHFANLKLVSDDEREV